MFVVGSAILSPIYSWHRDRLEAQREGWDYEPLIRMEFHASGRCEFINAGTRELAEVTLEWREYFVDATECRGSTMYFQTVPAAETHKLLPREKLEIVFPDDRREQARMNFTAVPRDCAPEHDCHILVVCEANYHRAADLKDYGKSQAVFLEDDCTSLVPVKNLFSMDSNGGAHWKDQRHERAWDCFASNRRREKQPMQMHDDFNSMFDGYLDRR